MPISNLLHGRYNLHTYEHTSVYTTCTNICVFFSWYIAKKHQIDHQMATEVQYLYEDKGVVTSTDESDFRWVPVAN